MAFVNEIPSAEDIEKYDLPYALDLGRAIEHRRTWTVDRKLESYLIGPGLTGNPAFEDEPKMAFTFCLFGSKFETILEPKQAPGDFNAVPYHVHWPALLEIWTVHPQENRMVEVFKLASPNPDLPNPLLQNRSLNEFVEIFKEAVAARKEGNLNKHINAPITVSFGF